jgi:hypothetical protein
MNFLKDNRVFINKKKGEHERTFFYNILGCEDTFKKKKLKFYPNEIYSRYNPSHVFLINWF